MGMRNYCIGYFDEATSKLDYWLQVEVKAGVKGTKGYVVQVPKLKFGSAAISLYSKQVKQHLLLPLSISSSSSAKLTSLLSQSLKQTSLKWRNKMMSMLQSINCFRYSE